MLEKCGLKTMNMTIRSTSYPSSFVKSTTSRSLNKTIKLIAPLLAGTGGVMTAHGTAEGLTRWVYNPRIHIEPSIDKKIDLRSPAEHIANIRDVLDIKMSDLASILWVTRPTVYAWLAGQEPKGEAVIRIQHLSRIADKIHGANIIRLDKLIHRPVLNGLSVLDILKTDEDPTAAIAILKAIADKEEQTRHEQKGSGKHLRSFDDVLGDFSVAIYEGS
jgi:CheY-like chemotaxis protein